VAVEPVGGGRFPLHDVGASDAWTSIDVLEKIERTRFAMCGSLHGSAGSEETRGFIRDQLYFLETVSNGTGQA
jgi:hypothetical protein